MNLAANYGIADPPNAAGGCLLTDPQFSKRVRDLFKFMVSEPSINDMELLKVGRHFRLDSNSKLVVGRNHGENEMLLSLCEDEDYVIQPVLIPGPVSVLRFHTKPDMRKHKKLLQQSAKITLRYSDTHEGKPYEVQIVNKKKNWKKLVLSQRCERNEVEIFRI